MDRRGAYPSRHTKSRHVTSHHTKHNIQTKWGPSTPPSLPPQLLSLSRSPACDPKAHSPNVNSSICHPPVLDPLPPFSLSIRNIVFTRRKGRAHGEKGPLALSLSLMWFLLSSVDSRAWTFSSSNQLQRETRPPFFSLWRRPPSSLRYFGRKRKAYGGHWRLVNRCCCRVSLPPSSFMGCVLLLLPLLLPKKNTRCTFCVRGGVPAPALASKSFPPLPPKTPYNFQHPQSQTLHATIAPWRPCFQRASRP